MPSQIAMEKCLLGEEGVKGKDLDSDEEIL